MSFYVYILECSDGSYYTGHTDNLEKRIGEHSTGKYHGYTSDKLPVNLVFSEDFGSRDSAFIAERKIKGWSRRKKKILISSGWESIKGYSKKYG